MTGPTTRILTVVVALLTVTAVLGPATAGAGSPATDAGADSIAAVGPGEPTVDASLSESTAQTNQTGSNVTLSGRVVLANGTGAVRDRVWVSGGQVSEVVVTDADGNWNLTVPPNASYDLGYFQGDPDGEFVTGVDDDSPDVLSVRSVAVGAGPRDLGTVTLPAAFDLNVTVVDDSGNPVENAQVSVGHRNTTTGAGFGGANGNTNSDGLFETTPGDPGVEIRGQAEIEVNPPFGSTEFVAGTVERTVNVTADRGVTVTLNDTVADVTGTVLLNDSTPAESDFAVTIGETQDGAVTANQTDASGNYALEVPENDTYGVSLYQFNETTSNLTERDGTADAHFLGTATVQGADVSLGTDTLPAGHLVNVSVVDGTGAPVQGVFVEFGPRPNATVEAPTVLRLPTTAHGVVDENPDNPPGIELAGHVMVRVNTTGNEGLVNETLTRNVTVTGTRNVTFQVNRTDGGSVSIQQVPGFTTSDGLNTTKIVGVRPDANLGFDDGTDYRFRLADEDSGQSVTLAANGSAELGADDPLGLRVHDSDGSVAEDPKLLLPLQSTQLPADVVNGSIPSASGLTNFSVSLLNASDGTAIDTTTTEPSVVGYTGVLAQNGTSGDVRLSLPRDVVPPTANVTLALSEGDLNDGSPRFEFSMAYDAGADEFAAVVDASDFSAGDYSWETFHDWRGTEVLQVRSPGSANENVTLDGRRNVTVTGRMVLANGSGAVNDRLVVVGPNGNRNVPTDANGNFDFSVPANASYDLGYHQSDGVNGPVTSVDDGSPDLYSVRTVTVGATNRSLGNVTLPTAHQLNVSVVDESGDPVPNASVFTVAHRNLTNNHAFGTGAQVNANGLVTFPGGHGPGVEMVGRTIVEVDPPANSSQFVQKRYMRTLDVTAPDSITIQLNETDTASVDITQQHGFGTADAVNTTKIVGVSADANLTLDNGTNYRFRLTDEDSGQSVTLAANGSAALGVNDPIGLRVHDADGSIDPPTLLLPLQSTQLPADVVNGSIPAASGTTNFSVTLLNASTGAPIDTTATEPSVVGYTGVLAQNSTSGDVRLSLPRDVAPRGSNVTLALSEGNLHDGSPRFEFAMAYDAATDEFATVVDANSLAAGNYSWETFFEWRGTSRILQVRSPNSANENVTLDSETVTITGTIERADGTPAANDFVAVGGAGLGLDVGTDENGTFSVSVPANATYSLGYYQGNFTSGVKETSLDDGWTDLRSLREVTVGTTNRSLGTMTLPAGHNLTVTVVNESGVPVENALVDVFHVNETAGAGFGTAPTKTDAQGRFRHGSPGHVGMEINGTTEVQVEPPSGNAGFVEKTYTERVTVTNDTHVRVQLNETDNVTLSGRMVLANGSGAVRDRVWVTSDGVSEIINTDADGNWNLTVPPNATYDLGYFQGDPDGRFVTGVDDDSPDLLSVRSVAVGAGPRDLGTVTLPTAHDLNVSVVDESDDPVEGATVDVGHRNTTNGHAFGSANGDTSAAGLFEITPGDPGVEIVGQARIRVTPPQGSSRFVDETVERFVNVTSDGEVTVSLNETNATAPPTVNVTGRVFEADGDGAADDTVVGVVRSDAGSDAEVALTDAGGNFTLSDVNASEPYHVGYYQGRSADIISPSFMPNDGSPDVFAVDVVNATADVDLGDVALPAGHVVNVTVVDESGDPVENASVSFVHNNSATGARTGFVTPTDADGMVRPNGNATGLELVGDVTVNVTRPANASRFVDTTYTRALNVTGSEEVTVELREKHNVTGRLLESDGTAATGDFVATSAETLDVFEIVQTDANGTYAMTLAGADRYGLTFIQRNETAGFVTERDGTVDLYRFENRTVSGDVDLGTRTLPAGHLVNVSVVDESGDPVANAAVAFTSKGTSDEPTTVSLTPNTTAAGVVQPPTNVTPGIELAGNVTVEVTPPDGEERFVDQQYVRNLTVTNDTTVTVTLEEFAAFDVVTEPATGVDASSATLHGNLTGLGGSSSADVQFKYWVQGDEVNASFTPFRTKTATGQFTEAVTGLAANTTYVVRAQARNGSGVYTTGDTVEFTTPAAFGVATTPASNVTDTTATFHGDLTGLGGSPSADVQFKYWVKGDEANASFTPFRTRNATGPFTEDVTGLSPNTTYVVRAQARDASGTYTTGGTVQFTTATGFGVTTGTAANVTRSSATLHGMLDGLGGASSADVQFKYWVQGQQGSTTQFTSFQTLTAAGSFSADVSGLSANTTYVFRAQARDSTGTWTAGSTTTVTTNDVHDVDTESASNVTANTATFEATVNSLGGASSIDVQFKYWVQGDEANTSQWTPFRTVSSTGAFTEDVTGLSPNTTYVVRAQARNPSGEYDIGGEVTVTTPTAFAVETDAATGVDASAATLNGNLTGLGGASSADVQFKYWVQGDPANASFTSFQTLTATGTFSASLTGLSANTTYVVRAQARDSAGTWTAGTTRTFTTTEPFSVETDAATNVTSTSMTLNGNLTGLGGTASTDVQFKYWVKGEEATTSQWTSFETLTSPGPFGADVTGLSANTTYVVRAQARNADGEWTAGTTVEVTTD